MKMRWMDIFFPILLRAARQWDWRLCSAVYRYYFCTNCTNTPCLLPALKGEGGFASWVILIGCAKTDGPITGNITGSFRILLVANIYWNRGWLIMWLACAPLSIFGESLNRQQHVYNNNDIIITASYYNTITPRRYTHTHIIVDTVTSYIFRLTERPTQRYSTLRVLAYSFHSHTLTLTDRLVAATHRQSLSTAWA